MAITYRGIVETYIILGNDSTVQNLFSIENGIASRVNLNIRKLSAQIDSLPTIAAVAPLIRTSRATSISGGVILAKDDFDLLQTSDSNVVVRSALLESSQMTATPGDTIWEGFANRTHSATNQLKAYDINLLPPIVEKSGKEFILRPGQSLLVRVFSAATTSNPTLLNNWFVQVVWEEDALTTFAISGTVSLSGVGIDGAKVIVIEADDETLTNGFLKEIVTTSGGGLWSSTIKTGKVGAAFVQYKSGGTYYTAPGSPFLS